jgi:hypothetical protein
MFRSRFGRWATGDWHYTYVAGFRWTTRRNHGGQMDRRFQMVWSSIGDVRQHDIAMLNENCPRTNANPWMIHVKCMACVVREFLEGFGIIDQSSGHHRSAFSLFFLFSLRGAGPAKYSTVQYSTVLVKFLRFRPQRSLSRYVYFRRTVRRGEETGNKSNIHFALEVRLSKYQFFDSLRVPPIHDAFTVAPPSIAVCQRWLD